MPRLLRSLHLLREETKLNSVTDFTHGSIDVLASVIAQIGRWIGWDTWTWKDGCYYSLELGFKAHMFEDAAARQDAERLQRDIFVLHVLPQMSARSGLIGSSAD